VHLAARGLAALIFVVVASTQAATVWTAASPSYVEYTGLFWDSSWYRSIAEQGYPPELPRGADGRVQQNAWAFFPLFPVLVRSVMRVTGGSWEVVAPTVSLLLGAAAMLVVHRLVTAVVEPATSGWRRHLPLATVAVLTTSAASPVLQVGYTESLALLLLAGSLWCLVRRRYLLGIPVVLALGLTRAVALPLAVAVLMHAVQRYRSAHLGRPGDRERWAGGEVVALAVLGLATVASGLLWPVICGAVTGEPDAYWLTQSAWRGRGQVVLLQPWLDVARWRFGTWGVPLLAAAVVGAVLVVASRPMARMGEELRGWTAGYLAYLLVVIEPGTSLVRFLLLAFPVAGAAAQVALTRRRPGAAMIVLMALGVVGQVAWVALVWRLVPPAGWPP
jgi:hypothetical protein